jgi:hypothetical protein
MLLNFLSVQATDGSATTTQSVQVRVFDVNRVPRLTVSNHAVVISQTLSIPVQLGATPTPTAAAALWSVMTTARPKLKP